MSDLIDRQAAIDALNEYFDRIGKLKRRGLNKGEKAIRLDTVGTINSLPPAEPKRGSNMTNEKVIDILNGIKDGTAWLMPNMPEDGEKAIDIAIKAVEQSEPHWISVTEDTPDEERECWITPKTTSKVYRGVFTRHYGECHRTGFICDDGFMWLNTALAWMYCEVPEPYKGVNT